MNQENKIDAARNVVASLRGILALAKQGGKQVDIARSNLDSVESRIESLAFKHGRLDKQVLALSELANTARDALEPAFNASTYI